MIFYPSGLHVRAEAGTWVLVKAVLCIRLTTSPAKSWPCIMGAKLLIACTVMQEARGVTMDWHDWLGRGSTRRPKLSTHARAVRRARHYGQCANCVVERANFVD